MKKAKILALFLLLMSSSEAVLLSMDSITAPDEVKVSIEYDNQEVMEKLCSYVEENKCFKLQTLLNTLPDDFDVNQRIENCNQTLLWLAVEKGHPLPVVYLLKKGADVNTTSKSGEMTVLMEAARRKRSTMKRHKNDIDILRVLLGHKKIQIDQIDEGGMTALMYAVSDTLWDDSVRLLLKHGADVNVQNIEGNTALILAVECDYTDSLQLLLEKPEIDVNLVNTNGETAVSLAAQRALKHDMFDFLNMFLQMRQDIDFDLPAIKNFIAIKKFNSPAQYQTHIEIVRLIEEAKNARAASVVAQPCISDLTKRIITFTSPFVLLSALALITYSMIRDLGNATSLAL